ncbi:MAG TPA: VOC family protein [Candidatus Limnocylindrales bacterium]
MAETVAATANKPVWIDLSSSDAAASRDFYSKVFGWRVEVSTDPLYGGYGRAKIGDMDVAGIGPAQSPGTPTAWTVYIGTPDAEALGKKVQAAGGKVIAPAFDVGDQGRMAVFQDPAGAFISAWETHTMGGFQAQGPNSFSWAELNARGIEKAIPFYEAVFGWTARTSPVEGGTPYTEFLVDGESTAGGQEMQPMVPAEVPSYWMVYFGVDDVDHSYRKALEAGGHEMLAPVDFPGGRFAIVSDPQGASFGLMKMGPG